MSLDPKRLADVGADASPDDRLLADLIERHRQGRPEAAGLRSLAKRLDATAPVGALAHVHRYSLWGFAAVACAALAATAFRVATPATSPVPSADGEVGRGPGASAIVSPSSVAVANGEAPQAGATISVHELPSEPAPALGQAASASSTSPPAGRRANALPSKKTCDESELIDRAETLLRTGQPASALDAARQHMACGETVLAQERERIAIEALVMLERHDEARARARAFETSYPSSPHIRRIRQLAPRRAE